MNKIINSKCECGKYLSDLSVGLSVYLPCEHLIHTKCIKYSDRCYICDNNIQNILSFKEIIDFEFHEVFVEVMPLLSNARSEE